MAFPPVPQEQSEAQEQETQGGYTICIEVEPDGSLSVGVEQEAAMAPQAEAAEEASETGYKPAKNIKDALTMALEIFKNNGEIQQGQADDDFQADLGTMKEPM